jgi:predicted phage baseplate assembly protein
VLDAETAQLRFGNGRAGGVPAAGAVIELSSRLGGGPGGNVPAGTLVRLQGAPAAVRAIQVEQQFAARGGASAPDLPELEAQVVARLAAPERAITLDDLERLARATPGVPVARVRAAADYHPHFPQLPAAGCVTLAVVPRGLGPAPTPTLGLLDAVRAYLRRRRPVALELHVIAPTYTQVAVRARLHLAPDAQTAAVVAAASARLDAFFHPLTGGPDGDGWPIGRDVYRSEVLALLQEIAGVHHVDELLLLVGADRAPVCENVCVCPTDLVATRPHELTVAAERIR